MVAVVVVVAVVVLERVVRRPIVGKLLRVTGVCVCARARACV